ncbi:DsbA family protein [Nesterenkonia lacusekhoensis]|uniref:DsbA family dithiol-disulfide isomerase n=1 Tax=Nesterenkonia lacusekhoensis TaxID=150832 RepID=A0ABS4T117_9MICC|nr:thioredoxin domain-containing protein [Nesterenkonia lacusekhoensis]MBP2316991.1 putative DsbA family dithiol-disulfide isomerase [Nesterenkonia lacusekhoensis]
MARTSQNGSAREQARKMQQEQERKERMRSLLLRLGVVAVAVAVVVGLTFYVVNRGGGDGGGQYTTGAAPSVANEEGGITLTSTTELADGDDLGEVSSDDVPGSDGAVPGGVETEEGEVPHVVIYTDPSCPSCQQFEAENHEQIGEWLDAGQITVEYRSVNFVGQYAQRANGAIACVAEESPEHFYDFLGQATVNPDQSVDELVSAADGLGADISQCMDDNEYYAFTGYTTAQAQAQEIQGTPTIFVDGEQIEGWQEGAFAEAVNSAIEENGGDAGDDASQEDGSEDASEEGAQEEDPAQSE